MSADAPPAGVYRPNRVSLYHVAVSALDEAFGSAEERSGVKDVIVMGLRELLPLDASEEAFDEQHAKVREVERGTGDRTLSIPFEAAIDAVGEPLAVQCATLKVMMLQLEQMISRLPPLRSFDGFGAFGGEIDDVRRRTVDIDERPSSWQLPPMIRPASPTSVSAPLIDARPSSWLLPIERLASPSSVRAPLVPRETLVRREPLVQRETLVPRETRINALLRSIDANPAPNALLDSEWHLIAIGHWPRPSLPIRVYNEVSTANLHISYARGSWLSDVNHDGTPRLERPLPGSIVVVD